MEASQDNPTTEVPKTPQELYLDMIYDKNISKQERAQLIMNILIPNSSHSWKNEDGSTDSPIDRNSFYEPDFFMNNGYSHIIANFTDKGDEELFKMLTKFVLNDIQRDNFASHQDGIQTELFGATFNGDGKSNYGILINLARERRFSFIPILLDCFAELKCTEKLNVNVIDNLKKTFLHVMSYFGFTENAFTIYTKYKKHFGFNIELKDKEGKCLQDLFDKGECSVTLAIKNLNYTEFEEKINYLFSLDGSELEDNLLMPSTFASDSMGLSFIHSICMLADCRFIDLLLKHAKESKEKFLKITGFEDINREMNSFNQMISLSPIISVLINGKYDIAKVICQHIVKSRTIKIDISQKDARHRNILHCVLYNKNLSQEERLDLIDNYLLQIDDSMIYSAHFPNIRLIFNQVDKDGFLPIVLFLSRVKPETQDDSVNQKLFYIISDKTDYENTLKDLKCENFQHPLILCIKSKLDKYFSKFLDSSETLRKQIIYIEKNTGRTSLEYAFESDMKEFIQLVLSSLDRIESFIVSETKGDCITLFDVFLTIVKNARTRHIFILKAGENESSNPTVDWIKKLAEVIFEDTKDKMNNRAVDFLKDFAYSPAPVIEEIPKPKIAPKMPPALKKKIMDDYNKRVEEAKSQAIPSGVLKTSNDILSSSFDLNDHYSYPYLFKYVTKKTITVGTLYEALKCKHDEIFNLIFDYAYVNKDTIGIDEELEIITLQYLFNDISFKLDHYIPGISIREFYSELHNKCYNNPGIDIIFHKIYLLLKEFNKSYESIKQEHVTELILSVLEALQKATGAAYKMCIEPLIDLIQEHNILLKFSDEGDVSLRIKDTFKKLLFEQNYDYTLKLQECVYSSLKVYYQSLVEVYKTKDQKWSKETNESNYDDEENTEGDISTIFLGLLNSITQFENYNQIDFNTNPQKIIQVMKGFVFFGGYSYINIGFGATDIHHYDDFESHKIENKLKQKSTIQRIMGLLDEFKESRK